MNLKAFKEMDLKYLNEQYQKANNSLEPQLNMKILDSITKPLDQLLENPDQKNPKKRINSD